MLFKSKRGKKSKSILYERLLVKTRIDGDSNPLLLMLEERISDLLNEKYVKEFQINSLNSKLKSPDYEVDAEVDYQEDSKDERGFWAKLFSPKKSNSVVKNRLDILIQGRKDDCILGKIKKDIYQMAKDVIDVKEDHINVVRCYDDDNVEVIKMIISLPQDK